jgi:hypothetical protein
MATPKQPHPPARLWRELVVPGVMLGGIAFYLYEARHLSLEALILPLALVAVIGAALLAALAQSFADAGEEREGEEEEAQGRVHEAKPWLLVAAPSLLIAAWELLGALPALVAVVFCAQLILDARRPLRSLVVAVAIALPTYALFQYFLYVRFPRGVLGLG